jgi:hypothetical protein
LTSDAAGSKTWQQKTAAAAVAAAPQPVAPKPSQHDGHDQQYKLLQRLVVSVTAVCAVSAVQVGSEQLVS